MVSRGTKAVCSAVVALVLAVCGGMNASAGVDVVGLWEGSIAVQGSELGIAVKFAAGDSGLTGAIDIPVQQAKDVPLANIKLDSNAIAFDMPGTPGEPKFTGVVAADGKTIAGDFTQSGEKFPFTLTKAEAKAPDSTVAAKTSAPEIKIDPVKAETKEKPVTIAYTTNPSGLQWRDLVAGAGDEAKAGQIVDVHYTGWLYVDGKKGSKFDSSVDRGQPFSFPLGKSRVIKGWDEGVAGMKIGGKRELLIPPGLGYGAQGTPGGPIPPNATLLFEVELLKVK
jgi:peptidylprolyl isomerase